METKIMKRSEETVQPIKPTTEAGLWRKKPKVRANESPDLLPVFAALAVFPLLFRENLNCSGSIVRL
jgi:hypothetical protein